MVSPGTVLAGIELAGIILKQVERLQRGEITQEEYDTEWESMKTRLRRGISLADAAADAKR